MYNGKLHKKETDIHSHLHDSTTICWKESGFLCKIHIFPLDDRAVKETETKKTADDDDDDDDDNDDDDNDEDNWCLWSLNYKYIYLFIHFPKGWHVKLEQTLWMLVHWFFPIQLILWFLLEECNSKVVWFVLNQVTYVVHTSLFKVSYYYVQHFKL
jgi:hypothetical protein